MLNQICELEIDGEKFEIKINVGTMIDAERQSGTSFMNLIKKVEKGGTADAAMLLSACLTKAGEDEGVGMEYIREMEFDTFKQLFEPLLNSIISAFPKADKKKPTVKIKKMTK